MHDDPLDILAAQHDEDTRYLALIRELAAATESHLCCPEDGHVKTLHVWDAAAHVNAIIGNPELLWKLLACSARFEKQPPPHIDELKQSFWRLAARQESPSDGSGETTSFGS